jgi:N utilization substance protein B
MENRFKGEMSRRRARECALQALYQQEFHPDQQEEVIRERANDLTGEYQDFYLQLMRGIGQHLTEIDATIERYLKKGWSVGRLATLDRAMLRLAVYELLFERETPKGVVLNEAVEISKQYSGEESSRFINGVLGSVAKGLEQNEKN